MIIRIGENFINLDKVNYITAINSEIRVYFDSPDPEPELYNTLSILGYGNKQKAIETIINADKIEFTTAHDKELESKL